MKDRAAPRPAVGIHLLTGLLTGTRDGNHSYRGRFHGDLRVRRFAFANQVTLFCVAMLAMFTIAGCAGVTTANNASNSNAPTAAAVATQPANQTVTVGQSATFSVTASGTAPLTYQWQKNTTNITGAA